MAQTIPEHYGMAHFLFQADGSPRISTFGIGFANPDDEDAYVVASVYAIASVTGSDLFVDTNMVAGWTFLGVNAMTMLSSGPQVGTYSVSIPGVKSGSPVPANSSHLISKGTPLGGRQGRGRAYCPPVLIGEASIDAMGFAASGTISAQQALLTDFFNEIYGGDFPPYLFHEAPVSPGPTPINILQLQPQLATQRRRLRK